MILRVASCVALAGMALSLAACVVAAAGVLTAVAPGALVVAGATKLAMESPTQTRAQLAMETQQTLLDGGQVSP